MNKARLAIALAFVIGLGLGAIAGPFSGSSNVTAATSFKYTCIKYSSFTGINIRTYNPGAKTAHVRVFHDGVEGDPFDVNSKTVSDTGSVDDSGSVGVVRFVSNRKLLITGTSYTATLVWDTPCFRG